MFFPDYIWNKIRYYIKDFVLQSKLKLVSRNWCQYYNEYKIQPNLKDFFMPLLVATKFTTMPIQKYSDDDQKLIIACEKSKWCRLQQYIEHLNYKHRLFMTNEQIDRMIQITFQIWKRGSFDPDLLRRSSSYDRTWAQKLLIHEKVRF